MGARIIGKKKNCTKIANVYINNVKERKFM